MGFRRDPEFEENHREIFLKLNEFEENIAAKRVCKRQYAPFVRRSVPADPGEWCTKKSFHGQHCADFSSSNEAMNVFARPCDRAAI